MTLFRSKLQILSRNTITNQGRCADIFDKRPKSGVEIFTRNYKFFWSSRHKPEAKAKCESLDKPPDNPLISKACPSKCLEGLKNPSEKEVIKKEKVCKPKESFWAYLFGEEAHENRTDPCTCRLAYKYKQSCRKEDCRLCDPRYTTTPGDVLLFSEFPKPLTNPSTEPQPQPPPLYKVPAGVTIKRIADAVAEHTCVHFCLPSRGDDCKGECLEPEPIRLPYAEFKPEEQARLPFTCEGGKRTEDVIKPIRKEMYPCGFPSFSTKNVDPEAKTPKKFSTCPSSSEDESFANSCKDRKKLSRIERLKKLTAGKQGVYKPLR